MTLAEEGKEDLEEEKKGAKVIDVTWIINLLMKLLKLK